jgi:hypothetical protein
MAEHTQILRIKEDGRERTVRVHLDGPSFDGLDIQSLAQEAWTRPGRLLRRGVLTVVVTKNTR